MRELEETTSMKMQPFLINVCLVTNTAPEVTSFGGKTVKTTFQKVIFNPSLPEVKAVGGQPVLQADGRQRKPTVKGEIPIDKSHENNEGDMYVPGYEKDSIGGVDGGGNQGLNRRRGRCL